ncbi:MAG: hypothetical protein JOZ48_08805 [Acidobacteriaceae bacterium]|nr:hypothetical protein [Acidobacteriaceae bacterium]
MRQAIQSERIEPLRSTATKPGSDPQLAKKNPFGCTPVKTYLNDIEQDSRAELHWYDISLNIIKSS